MKPPWNHHEGNYHLTLGSAGKPRTSSNTPTVVVSVFCGRIFYIGKCCIESNHWSRNELIVVANTDTLVNTIMCLILLSSVLIFITTS